MLNRFAGKALVKLVVRLGAVVSASFIMFAAVAAIAYGYKVCHGFVKKQIMATQNSLHYAKVDLKAV